MDRVGTRSDAVMIGTRETTEVTAMTAVVDMTVIRVDMIVNTLTTVEVAAEVASVTEDIASDIDDKNVD